MSKSTSNTLIVFNHRAAFVMIIFQNARLRSALSILHNIENVTLSALDTDFFPRFIFTRRATHRYTFPLHIAKPFVCQHESFAFPALRARQGVDTPIQLMFHAKARLAHKIALLAIDALLGMGIVGAAMLNDVFGGFADQRIFVDI